MPAKALDQVVAAVKHFQQANQGAAAGPLDQLQNGLSPQLWLQCRLQVITQVHWYSCMLPLLFPGSGGVLFMVSHPYPTSCEVCYT